MGSLDIQTETEAETRFSVLGCRLFCAWLLQSVFDMQYTYYLKIHKLEFIIYVNNLYPFLNLHMKNLRSVKLYHRGVVDNVLSGARGLYIRVCIHIVYRLNVCNK